LQQNNIITPQEHKELFANLDELIPVNQKLLRNLQGIEDLDITEQRIGPIFSQLSEDLGMYYRPYCVNQTKSMNLRETLVKRSPFVNFIQDATRDPKFNADNTNLDNLLIQPMQRICRYPLLLAELLKRTPADHLDAEDLKVALNSMNQVVDDINECQFQERRRSKLLDILSSFTNKRDLHLLTPTREFIKEGPSRRFKTSSGLTGNKGHLFLFNDLVIVACPCGKKLFTALIFFPLNSTKIDTIDNDPKLKRGFEFIGTTAEGVQDSCFIQWASEEEKVEWSQTIQNTINSLQSSNQQSSTNL